MSCSAISEPRVAVELYRRMLRIRMTEETIAARYSEGRMRCPTHLCTGQEAVAAAVSLALTGDDFVLSSHRSHGHYLAQGGDLKAMIAELYGKASGCSGGRGGSMHLTDRSVGFVASAAIVASTIPMAVGLALSARLHGTAQVSCVYLGDAAVEEGVFYESLNFAAVKKLPVLFVCENNLYSVYSPLSVRQPAGRRIHEMAAAIGVPAVWEDGNDAMAAHAAALAAVGTIRRGEGPRLVEYATYRWREHCGPSFDNDIGYRTEAEYLEWRAKDPVAALERRLLDAGAATRPKLDEMAATVRREIDDAFKFAEKSPFPSSGDALRGLYGGSGAET